ncbi:MAG: hypothetical protein SAK29_10620, partial [Scytonema sp. PMC 1069.18]|nr:hypothetical protein [Scytonema sp. PMC 1069.18]
DIGGGYFGNMNQELRQQFDCHIPSYQEYAEAIAPQVRRHFSKELSPELILEPGVALVSDVIKFVGKIVGIKTVRGRNIALVVGSIHNVKPTLTNKKLSLEVYQNDEKKSKKTIHPVDIVGYTCMEHDCLYEDYQGEIGTGDYTVFDNMGAYTIVFKPPFIRPNPPILCYDSITDEYTLSRRQENFDDVFCTYVI